jgi:hypothetical protein
MFAHMFLQVISLSQSRSRTCAGPPGTRVSHRGLHQENDSELMRETWIKRSYSWDMIIPLANGGIIKTEGAWGRYTSSASTPQGVLLYNGNASIFRFT